MSLFAAYVPLTPGKTVQDVQLPNAGTMHAFDLAIGGSGSTGPTATATTMTVDPSPAAVGQPFTIGVHVAATDPAAGAPSGTVTVDDGKGHTCTTAALNGTGDTHCTLTEAAPGTLTATYAGNTNFTGSTATATQTVKLASTTAVGATPNAGVGVAGVILFADIGPHTAGGTVGFTDGGALIPGCEARPVNADSASAASRKSGLHPV